MEKMNEVERIMGDFNSPSNKAFKLVEKLNAVKKEGGNDKLYLANMIQYISSIIVQKTENNFVIDELIKANYKGYDNYKENIMGGMFAENTEEIAAFTILNNIKKASPRNKPSLAISNLELIYINDDKMGDRVKRKMQKLLNDNKEMIGHKKDSEEVLNELNRYRYKEIEKSVKNTLENPALSTQEKMENIVGLLKMSSKTGEYKETLERVKEEVEKSKDPVLGEFIKGQLFKIEQKGLKDYIPNGIDFINFNQSPNEAAHMIYSRMIELSPMGENKVLEGMREIMKDLNSPEFLNDTMEALKVKLGSAYNVIGDKLNNYNDKPKLAENMLKYFAVFQQKKREKPANELYERPKI